MISPALLSSSSPLNYVFIQFPRLWSFISCPPFYFYLPLPSSAFALRCGGELGSLQHPNDVRTRPLRSNKKKKKGAFSFSFTPSLSEPPRRQSLQRPSSALASHLLFSHDSDPPTPGISSFPTGDGASLGHIIKSVWGTSSGATPVNTSQTTHTHPIHSPLS